MPRRADDVKIRDYDSRNDEAEKCMYVKKIWYEGGNTYIQIHTHTQTDNEDETHLWRKNYRKTVWRSI